MALTAADKREIAKIVAAALASTAPKGAPVTVAAASPVHVGPSGKPDGRQYPCTAPEPCSYIAKSPASAASHDPAAGKWHGATTPEAWAKRMARV